MKNAIVLLLPLLCALAGVALADQEVRLLYVRSHKLCWVGPYTAPGNCGTVSQLLKWDVLVQDIARDKAVSVALYDRNTSSWIDVPLKFARKANTWTTPNTELWSGEWQAKTIGSVEFFVRYTANGKSYVAKDSGNLDYVIPEDFGSIVYGQLAYVADYTDHAYVYSFSPRFEVPVYIYNKEFSKRVTLHFTTDKWVTPQHVSCGFASTVATYSAAKNPNEAGWEKWVCAAPLVSPSQTRITYVVGVEYGSGSTIWENNFGHDYTTELLWVFPVSN